MGDRHVRRIDGRRRETTSTARTSDRGSAIGRVAEYTNVDAPTTRGCRVHLSLSHRPPTPAGLAMDYGEVAVFVSAGLTDRCNLACDYCYAAENHGSDMTEATLDRVVDRAVSSTPAGTRLEFNRLAGRAPFQMTMLIGMALGSSVRYGTRPAALSARPRCSMSDSIRSRRRRKSSSAAWTRSSPK